MTRTAFLATALSLAATGQSVATPPSQCFGTVSAGRIEHSVKLPASGPNFGAYSSIASGLGRTHVHARVAGIVTAAYQALRASSPATRFMYGETGWPSGGSFRPHRSHQNGLSVDFFVPVLDAAGRSTLLPTSAANRYGYDIEFDAFGNYREYRIDFAAMAEHLHALDVAARADGAGLALVIVDPAFLDRLLATPRGPDIRRLPYMKGKPWVRHDEHYHVDFALPCKPLRR